MRAENSKTPSVTVTLIPGTTTKFLVKATLDSGDFHVNVQNVVGEIDYTVGLGKHSCHLHKTVDVYFQKVELMFDAWIDPDDSAVLNLAGNNVDIGRANVKLHDKGDNCALSKILGEGFDAFSHQFSDNIVDAILPKVRDEFKKITKTSVQLPLDISGPALNSAEMKFKFLSSAT